MIKIKETKDHLLLAELNEEIQTLHHQLYPNVFRPYDKQKVVEVFKERISQEGIKAYIALFDSVIAGYTQVRIVKTEGNVFQFPRHCVYIDQILVKSDFRKKGIGKALLDQISRLAKELEIPKIHLDHWTMNNSARSFFKRNGFEYHREVMSKSI